MREQAYPGEKPESVKPTQAVTRAFVDLALPACKSNGEVVVL